jgi:hypothetical protein
MLRGRERRRLAALDFDIDLHSSESRQAGRAAGRPLERVSPSGPVLAEPLLGGSFMQPIAKNILIATEEVGEATPFIDKLSKPLTDNRFPIKK